MRPINRHRSPLRAVMSRAARTLAVLAGAALLCLPLAGPAGADTGSAGNTTYLVSRAS